MAEMNGKRQKATLKEFCWFRQAPISNLKYQIEDPRPVSEKLKATLLKPKSQITNRPIARSPAGQITR
jgi:hypothetical protein